MKLITRASWGAKYGRGTTDITPGKGGVAVHYEGGGKLTGKAHSACAARVRGIESFHVNTNGWVGVAYSYLACEHGYVFEGRGLGHRTAANGTNTGNQNWYAVCALIGDKDIPSDALLSAIRDAIDYMRLHGSAGNGLQPHKHFFNTSCPGARLDSWVARGCPRPGQTGSTNPQAPSTTEALVKALPILKRGATGEDVETLQALLVARSHPEIKVDGDFGEVTEAAVEAVQQWGKVTADGIVGVATWAKLLRL